MRCEAMSCDVNVVVCAHRADKSAWLRLCARVKRRPQLGYNVMLCYAMSCYVMCVMVWYVMCIVSTASFMEAPAAHGERRHAVDLAGGGGGALRYAYGQTDRHSSLVIHVMSRYTCHAMLGYDVLPMLLVAPRLWWAL